MGRLWQVLNSWRSGTGSLARTTLVRVATRIALIVLIATAVSYFKVLDGLEDQALDGLSRYVEARRARESVPFSEAEASVGVLAEQYRQALASAIESEEPPFSEFFVSHTDDTQRTAEALFATESISGFVGKHAPRGPQAERPLVAAIEVLRRFGPAWRGRFANAYVITPENGVVMFWPERPWARDSGDWEIYSKLALIQGNAEPGTVVVAGAPDRSRGDEARWSSLYFDYGVNEWVISVTRPVYVGDRYVASVGHDLLLQDLIDRVVTSDIEGTYNLIIDTEGRLLAHPSYMEAIQANGGSIPVARTNEPHLQRIFDRAAALGAGGGIVELDSNDEFLASSQLAGPGWYLLTVFPKQIIASQASTIAYLILGLGLVALLLELGILSSVLRRQVGQPLAALADVADQTRIGGSSSDSALAALGTDRRDELGTLARAFRDMVIELQRRESDLAASNEQLSRLNEQLEHELEERARAELELARNRELNALLNSIDYGVLFLDRDLNSRLANEAYRRMWDMPDDFYAEPRSLRQDMEKSQEQGLYGVTAEDWPAYLEERLAQVRAGAVGPREISLTNGRTLQYECIVLPDGGRMMTYYDITALKRVDAQLRQHLEGMEVSMDGMALLDAQGCYYYVNDAHAQSYGYTPKDMIGVHWRDLYGPEELSRFDEEILPIMGREGRWRGEAIGRRRNGSKFPQELSLALTSGGGIVCVVRDISERKRRERALDRALAEAERSNAAKSRFLASMSHELRTPLNAIIGFSRLVARRTQGTIPEQQTENLGKIQISAEHLLKLINEILDISKIEAGRMEITRTAYSPVGVVEECLRTIEPMVQGPVTLDLSVSPNAMTAVGDAAKVRQIVTNLLSNAVRHTTTGSIRAKVWSAESRLLIAVTDSGSGIPKEAMQHIFEEFGQAPAGAGTPGGGTGLGLTISRRLARLMGGDIKVESELGVGSTFTLELPRNLHRGGAHQIEASAEAIES